MLVFFVLALCCGAALAQTWTLYAQTDGTVLMNAWTVGLNTPASANYIGPCSSYLQWGDSAVLRITMGAVVDYFRPNAGLDLCGEPARAAGAPGAGARLRAELPALGVSFTVRNSDAYVLLSSPLVILAQRAICHAQLLQHSLRRKRVRLACKHERNLGAQRSKVF
jgi:hypothetical protein